MRTLILALTAAALALTALAPSTPADEGMWLFTNPPTALLKKKYGFEPDQVLSESVAAVSVGLLDGEVLLDLDYVEDKDADVDLNLVMTGSGRGSSGSASVSPIVISGMPATAMISPGPASAASTRSRASVT